MVALPLNRHIPPTILHSVPFLAVLTDRQLAHLLPFTHYHVHRRGAFIIRAGERADKVYVLVDGRAQVILDDGTGREMILCSIGKNEFFGEMSAIDGAPRSASVQAADACEVISFPISVFTECLMSSARATMLLVQCLVARVRATDVRVAELAFADVTARLAGVLLEAMHERKGEWIIELGPEQLARMVAASREMVSRVLKRLHEQGIIDRQRRRIAVLDRPALEEVASGGD
jgi:CRP/FNR family transcriptional regulator, cyclic AMP receptor protein